MPDNLLSADLGPVTWTSGATTREPHPEGRELKREQKRAGARRRPAQKAAASDATENDTTENIIGTAPHQLDRFA